MRLKENSISHEFKTEDVFGVPVSLEQFRGKRVLLAFLRYTGCPICNLHVHDLLNQEDAITKNELNIIIVYESSVSSIRKYIESENVPFTFISDPKQALYRLYMVEKSWNKFLKWGLSSNGLINAFKGFAKFHRFFSMKGSISRIEAEFLIDKNGVVEKVHYGSMVGDYMPVSNYLK